jgi:hypothetical protein
MRTSLAEIKQTEDFLTGNMEAGESVIFRSQVLLSPRLRLNLFLQEKLYRLVFRSGRRQLREEIGRIDHRLFSDGAFREPIEQIFIK